MQPAATAATGARPSAGRSRRPDGEPSPGRGHPAARAPRRGHSRPSARHLALLPRRPPLLPLPRLPAPAAFGSAAARPGGARSAASSRPAASWARRAGEGEGGGGAEPRTRTFHGRPSGGGQWKEMLFRVRGDVAKPMVSKLCCTLDVGARLTFLLLF